MKHRAYWHKRLVYRQKQVKWFNKFHKYRFKKPKMAIVVIMDMPSDLRWAVSELDWYKKAINKYRINIEVEE